MNINPENIYFILVEPRHPGNIGASARAIKTMGFTQLILINPGEYDIPECRWMAHASQDILEKIKIFDSLQEALTDIHFVIATTQRDRGYHLPFYTPIELGEKIIPVSQSHRVAIVFGRERTGLTNDELRMCHVISTIPAALNHPSLNLSQAVMLYAYELFKNSYEKDNSYQWNLAPYQDIEGVYKHLRESLQKIQFVPRDNWDNFIMRFQRIFARANPEVRDVGVMHKIFQSFDEYIRKLEKKSQ